MFEIRKEVVNAVGNVQSSEFIGYVDCNLEDVINCLSKVYCNLARAKTLYYKLRGQSYTVRYIFINTPLADIDTVIALAKADIKANVEYANDYIEKANRAYKHSNRKRGIVNNSMLLATIDVNDYLWDSNEVNDKSSVIVIR